LNWLQRLYDFINHAVFGMSASMPVFVGGFPEKGLPDDCALQGECIKKKAAWGRLGEAGQLWRRCPGKIGQNATAS
jgi:hypothetical protein